jgi:hypothetical protein
VALQFFCKRRLGVTPIRTFYALSASGATSAFNTAAILFSLIATGQRHKVDAFAYLRDVLTRLAATPLSQLDQFLPDRWQPAPQLTAVAD